MSKADRARKIIESGRFTVPSPDEVERAQSGNGGWSAEQLAMWGVPWPPLVGWRTRLHERWLAGNPPAIDGPTQRRNDALCERSTPSLFDQRYPGYDG